MKDQRRIRTPRRQKRLALQAGCRSNVRHRMWLLLIFLPLLAVGLSERRVTHSRIAKTLSNRRPVALLPGCLVLFLLLSWGCWSACRPPLAQRKRDAARRRERIRLFHLAQGKRPWHAFQGTQVVLALLGFGFFLLGLFLDVHAIRSGPSLHLGSLVLGLGSLLGGLILLLETLLVLPHRFKDLPSQSATLLKERLLAEEYEAASQPANNPEEHQ